MSEILYILPKPKGDFSADDVVSVTLHADNANMYLESVGNDTRLAVYEKPRGIVFPMTSADFATYEASDDAGKAVIYQTWIDSLTK